MHARFLGRSLLSQSIEATGENAVAPKLIRASKAAEPPRRPSHRVARGSPHRARRDYILILLSDPTMRVLVALLWSFLVVLSTR